MTILADALEALPNRVFVTTEPETLDFTNPTRAASLVIMGPEARIDVPFPRTNKEFHETLGLVRHYIAREGLTVIGWNLKSLFSYVLGRKANLCFESRLIDLKPMEAFRDVRRDCPKTYQEALQRLTEIVKCPEWGQLSQVYQEVHLPLITRVLPGMESTGLNDVRAGRALFPFYEVEGQVNGRLRCASMFSYGYSPHNLTTEQKDCFRPTEYDRLFLYFDFRHMEVATLQWLAKDEVLGEIFESGGDVYCGIWERVTGLECGDRYRQTCKDMFLPVIYGQGARSLAVRLGVNEITGKKLVSGIYRTFPASSSWASNSQASLDVEEYVHDHFGRRRKFEDDYYKIRNFCVQAPAAIVCLHKLVLLFDLLEKNKDIGKLVYSLHDGYGILAEKRNWRKVAILAQQVLEAEDHLYPGLRLRTALQVGEKLSQLRVVESLDSFTIF